MAVNAEGTRRLVQAVVRGNKRLRRLVYVSSLAAAGPCPGSEPLDERAEPHPLEGYGLSKLVAEQVVLAERRRLPVCIVRPPAVYGPRDTNFLPLFRAAQRYRLAPVIGSTRKQVSLVHVADLVEGIWLAATRLRQGFGGQARPDQGFGGLGSLQQGGGEAASPDGTASVAEDEVFFIGSGTHSWLEIVAALGTALGVRLRSPRLPALLARLVGELGELKWMLTRKPQIICRRKVRDMLQERWTCSWARAERELGYRPRVALADGLRETAEWYASQGWLRPLRNP
jgi:nucleoside-diphosphate-sugar epimerase